MIGKVVKFDVTLLLLIVAVVGFVVGAVIHDPPRAKSPLFWGLVGLACFAGAFLAARFGV